MIGKYSLFNLLKEYKENKTVIDSYMKNQKVENFDDPQIDILTVDENTAKSFLGLSIGVFVLLLLASLGIWIWAIVVTVKFWNKIPDWAKVLAIIGLVTGIGGPVMTLIVVYVSKSK